MPFTVLNVVPVKLAEVLFGEKLDGVWQKIRIGRLATVLFSALIGLFVYKWSDGLYGKIPGLVSLGLYVFEPNIIAHSRLMTTDIYASGMILISVYFFWRFLDNQTWKNALVSSFVLGLSQIAKYSSVFLYPVLIIIVILRYWARFIHLIRTKDIKAFVNASKRIIAFGVMFVIISLLIINIGFLFNDTFMPLGEYQFKSELFQSIQTTLSRFSGFPIPVPYPYIEGLDFIAFRERTGSGYGNIYLFGELREGEGFAGYFLFAFLFKVPIALQLILIISLVYYFRTREQRDLKGNELFLLVPALFFFIYFNFLFRAQIGIRFFLVVFPFLLILCGGLFQKWAEFSSNKKRLAVLAWIYLVISVLSYHPHYLSYFNEFVLNRSHAYKILADSNLDWGQNKGLLPQLLAENPTFIYEPTEPTPGRIVVGVNKLTGVREGPEAFAWLRENFEPIDHYVYSYLIYNVSPERLNLIP